MFKRNWYPVDISSICVCYLNCYKGGTAYTVNYAKQKGLRIINLSPSLLILYYMALVIISKFEHSFSSSLAMLLTLRLALYYNLKYCVF